MANWQDKKWQGETIKRGQFITSTNNLSIQTGMSVKQVRNRIKRLEDTNEIVTERTNKYTKITVCKYDTYQSMEIEEGKQKANKGQTKGKQRATTKEGKEYKEVKKARFTPPDSLLALPNFENAWIDFEDHRKAIGKKMTEVAADRIFSKIMKLKSNPIDVINQSIENGWTGIFEVKTLNNNQQQSNVIDGGTF
jgi:hypothetical protein